MAGQSHKELQGRKIIWDAFFALFSSSTGDLDFFINSSNKIAIITSADPTRHHQGRAWKTWHSMMPLPLKSEIDSKKRLLNMLKFISVKRNISELKLNMMVL